MREIRSSVVSIVSASEFSQKMANLELYKEAMNVFEKTQILTKLREMGLQSYALNRDHSHIHVNDLFSSGSYYAEHFRPENHNHIAHEVWKANESRISDIHTLPYIELSFNFQNYMGFGDCGNIQHIKIRYYSNNTLGFVSTDGEKVIPLIKNKDGKYINQEINREFLNVFLHTIKSEGPRPNYKPQ